MLHVDDLLAEAVDPLGDRGVAAEHLPFDLLLVDGDSLQHGGVAVDDRVEESVHDRLRAQLAAALVGEQGALSTIRRLHLFLVEVGAVRAVDPPLVLAEHRHRAWSDEHVELSEVDLLGCVDVASGTDDEEQDVAVALQLGALAGIEQVLDQYRMQVPGGGQFLDCSGCRRRIEVHRHPVGRGLSEPQAVGDRGVLRCCSAGCPSVT